MTDRPIIFSAPMVKALLAGRKTQTRRILKPYAHDPDLRFGMTGYKDMPLDLWECSPTGPWFRIPYHHNDRLYVREAFSYETLDVERNGFMPIWYWADGNPDWGDWTKQKPSIHMPRWASRLTLTVTGVQVQRLQEISRDDALAEGAEVLRDGAGEEWHSFGTAQSTASGPPVYAYAQLWDSLHGTDAWVANPWVVAISFTVAQGNIDQLGNG